MASGGFRGRSRGWLPCSCSNLSLAKDGGRSLLFSKKGSRDYDPLTTIRTSGEHSGLGRFIFPNDPAGSPVRPVRHMRLATGTRDARGTRRTGALLASASVRRHPAASCVPSGDHRVVRWPSVLPPVVVNKPRSPRFTFETRSARGGGRLPKRSPATSRPRPAPRAVSGRKFLIESAGDTPPGTSLVV